MAQDVRTENVSPRAARSLDAPVDRAGNWGDFCSLVVRVAMVGVTLFGGFSVLGQQLPIF